MPLYEFLCEKCGKKFEELVFGDKTPACPDCGSSSTEKLLSANCRRYKSSSAGGDYSPPASGGGCAGCSGGNCGSCGA
ncbi:MAG: zinc ribbon domain-containing protein [Desulfovibrio sp.]|nr:zinc ribbon domain-containing protein [Desulfovibrio sp.]